MPAYPPGANFRYEHPVTIRVLSGQAFANGQPLEAEAAEFPGGADVTVATSAYIIAEPLVRDEPEATKAEPTRDELRAEAKALGLSGYANLPKKKLAAKVRKARS